MKNSRSASSFMSVRRSGRESMPSVLLKGYAMLDNNSSDDYSTTFSPRAAPVDEEEEELSDIEDEDEPV